MKSGLVVYFLMFFCLIAKTQVDLNGYALYSYSYQEVVHEEIFNQERLRDAEILEFDFGIRIKEIDREYKVVDFEFVLLEIIENNRKNFTFFERYLDVLVNIKYTHEEGLELEISESFDKNREHYYRTRIPALTNGLKKLFLYEFGLFDGLFISKEETTFGTTLICEDAYEYQYDAEVDSLEEDALKIELLKVYDKSILEKNLKKNLERHFQKSIELNYKLKGEDFDPMHMEGYKELRYDQLNQVLQNKDLAEDVVVQIFKANSGLPSQSNAEYYNFDNICKLDQLSLYYFVDILAK